MDGKIKKTNLRLRCLRPTLHARFSARAIEPGYPKLFHERSRKASELFDYSKSRSYKINESRGSLPQQTHQHLS